MITKRSKWTIMCAVIELTISTGWRKSASAATTPPPPTFVTDACDRTPFIIPFEDGSSRLTSFGLNRISRLVSAWNLDHGEILASGRIDGKENKPGQTLSSSRLQEVKRELIARGIPAAAIWTRNDGAIGGVVPNISGKEQADNRVVWITLPYAGRSCENTILRKRAEWVNQSCVADQPTAAVKQCHDVIKDIGED